MPPAPAERSAATKRRRLGKVVHDERGNGSVQWEDAPADYERVVLEVINDGRAGRAEDFNPYAQRVPRARDSTGATTRTDLRTLSDWIKKMRALEERQRNAHDQDEDSRSM